MSSISSILYNITIYPFELIIDIILMMFSRSELGVRFIFTGILVNVIALPLYNIADKLQKRESDLQANFKKKIDEIKAVFKGDKRQMLIQTFYRINNYHPIYSLRGLLGLFIQVPIFIAAYKAITSMVYATNFLMISDLSKPDALIHIGDGIQINLLPIVMTIVNIIASLIHTRNLSNDTRSLTLPKARLWRNRTRMSTILSKPSTSMSSFAQNTSRYLTNKERMPLFVMAGIFLVLLYNSPSGLLVYWITTNLFSLVKNIVLLNPKAITNVFSKTKIFWIVLSIMWLLSPLPFYFQLLVPGSDTFEIITPGIFIILVIYIYKILTSKIVAENYNSDNRVFVISILVLSVLFGLFIPSSLIGSSPEEFYNPFNIIVNTFSKSAGIFLIYPMLLYFFSGEKIKRMLTILFTFVSIFAIINTFVFTGDYGTLSTGMIFSNKDILVASNLDVVLSITSVALIILFIWRKLLYKTLFKTIATISIIILFLISFFDIYKIDKEIKGMSSSSKSEIKNTVSKIIDMSNNGKNVFIFFFDAGLPSYIPKIIERIPELKNELDGFTFYNNTASFSSHTVSTISALLGGYEYRTIEMNKRDKETLKDKNDEATLVLPLIFRSNNYSATIIYPSYAGWSWEPDISAFKKHPDINAYSRPFSVPKSLESEMSKKHFDEIVLNFAFFRISPSLSRFYIYNDGKWFLNKYSKSIPTEVIEYTYLKELTNMINIVSNTNTYTYFGNDLTHDFTYFNSDYLPAIERKEVPKEDIEKYGSENNARRLYDNVRMFLELVNFVEFLKANNMYDNTKIIVVSDHGVIGLNPPIFKIDDKNFSDDKNNSKLQALHTMLMVKDFNSQWEFKIDNTNFMTIADVPLLATSHFSNVINPFTKKELKADKENGIIFTPTPFSIRRQNKNTFVIDGYFHIKNGNIFDMDNWSEISNK